MPYINNEFSKCTNLLCWIAVLLSILDESGTAENKELLFSHDKLLLASILRPLHQVTEEMLAEAASSGLSDLMKRPQYGSQQKLVM